MKRISVLGKRKFVLNGSISVRTQKTGMGTLSEKKTNSALNTTSIKTMTIALFSSSIVKENTFMISSVKLFAKIRMPSLITYTCSTKAS